MKRKKFIKSLIGTSALIGSTFNSWSYEKNNIQEIIDELEQSDILNDSVFANSKAFHYIRMGKSKKMIELNLLKKGINKIIIQKTLEKFENDIPNLEYESANNFAKNE